MVKGRLPRRLRGLLARRACRARALAVLSSGESERVPSLENLAKERLRKTPEEVAERFRLATIYDNSVAGDEKTFAGVRKLNVLVDIIAIAFQPLADGRCRACADSTL